MFKKSAALKICTVVLFILGIVDLTRGFAHTFAVKQAATKIAEMDPHPDALVVMGAFGMSNFLTGVLYILISRKAKEIAPAVLLIIPAAYLLGSLGLRYSGVTMQSAFSGQYMMRVYLLTSLFASLYYFTIAYREHSPRSTSMTGD